MYSSSWALTPTADRDKFLSTSDSTALIDRGQDGGIDERSHASDSWPRTKNHLLSTGWRRGVTTAAITTSIVFLINLGITIWAATRQGTSGGVGILYHGACTNSRQINTVLHLLINTLSTLLLSASNYTMQCLSSPTRAEVDQAHKKGVWLDIGIPSLRNLTGISWRRRVLWGLLALSSLPLHLL